MLYSICWLSLILWLPLLFEIMSNMYIAITCCPACNFIRFEIYLSFLIKPFPQLSYQTISPAFLSSHFPSFLIKPFPCSMKKVRTKIKIEVESCSLKFCNIHRKVADRNFIEKRLQHWCFPLSIGKLLRTPILKNIC